MTVTQIILVILTAAILGFIILSNKKSPKITSGTCSKCGSKSESLQSVENKLVCRECSSVKKDS
ncbi:MAG: hypothetical protein LBI42_04485 [Chitinispirillales bacterium]|nr:hypothetical protein [Chitinispirillales bacterium]